RGMYDEALRATSREFSKQRVAGFQNNESRGLKGLLKKTFRQQQCVFIYRIDKKSKHEKIILEGFTLDIYTLKR
ncbi:MAG: hypothetical protein IKN57_07840, partial [Parasporobacterium sp.]|nr:hypothetical protein [Parasporobacterium sp.]